MDREQLNQIKAELSTFISKINEGKHKLDYACLIPAFEGTFSHPFVLQVNAEWVEKMDCSEAIKIIVNYLFDNTSPELREKIYRIDIFDKNKILCCQSEDFVLYGEMPLVMNSVH